MKRCILVSIFAVVGFSSTILGCTRAASVCDVVCECEHCSDQTKIVYCNELQTQADVAQAYGCGEKWETYAICFETRGECDANTSRYSSKDEADKDRCETESEALRECIESASDHGFATSN